LAIRISVAPNGFRFPRELRTLRENLPDPDFFTQSRPPPLKLPPSPGYGGTSWRGKRSAQRKALAWSLSAPSTIRC